MRFPEFDQGILPRWALVRHRLDSTEITDVPGAVAKAFATMAGAIRPGARVCLCVGSRGIDRIDEVTRAKDISGLGLDSNVTGRYYSGHLGVDPEVQRIIIRDITPDSEGNATGIGLADVALRLAVDKMDVRQTYMNCITAKTPDGARIPITVDSDREALAIALACCLQVDPANARIVRIRDTKHLEQMYVSESLLPGVLATGTCDLLEEPHPIAFDSEGMFA